MRFNILVSVLMLVCVAENCVDCAPQEMSDEPMGGAGAEAGMGAGASAGAQVGAQFGAGIGMGTGFGAGIGAKFGLGANFMGMGKAGAGMGGTGGMLRMREEARFEAGLRYGQVDEKYDGQVYEELQKYDGLRLRENS